MIIRKVDRIEHGLLNMNMIITEKHDSLVASGYNKLTSSSGLLKIPSEVLDTFFDNTPENITLENFRALLPEGKDIYDYGDLCHKAIEKEMEEAKEMEEIREKERNEKISQEEMDTLKDMSIKGDPFEKITHFIYLLFLEEYNFNIKDDENGYTVLQNYLFHVDYNRFIVNSIDKIHDCNQYTYDVLKCFDRIKSKTNINAKDKNGNSIIHTAIINCKYQGPITTLLIKIGEKFDFDCKNNQNMGIIETLYECIDKYSRSSDNSIRYKGMLLSDESEEIKAIVYGLIKYQKDRKQIISENDKNNKTEKEIENISNKISSILGDIQKINTISIYNRFLGYSAFKKIESEMKYYRNEVTHNIVFNLDTILAIKKAIDIEYKFMYLDPNRPMLATMFPNNTIFIDDAIYKFNECTRNDKKIAEEVTTNREHCKLIERFLRKIVYKLSFIDIIENKDLILLFKKVLKENFDYIIEHTSNMETEEDFILAWSKYEEKLKETIRVGIKILKTPVNDNETQNILKTLEAFGFNEEINLLNKKIGNTTDEANKAGNSSILAPIKKESKDQIKKILKAGLEVLLSTPDINTINMMLPALEECGLNEEVEILKKEIADYTAGNLLEEVIEDEIKTGKLSNSEIYYLQSIFENNGFKNVSKLIENKVKEKEKKEKEKEKVKKKGKI